ncbi:MAG TPA: BT_3928 family protein, partial [Bacteroidia bacterium]|nr:BT_3928 family protein [Bacteroidia bacterium]
MKTLVKICAILVGLLFIFSGFVKADDPVGFAIKLQEYFDKDALNLPWLNGFALTFSIIIPIVEMVLGFMILIGARRKFTLWMLLLTILFFSFLTFYTAHYNKVLECGCFGDAIPMTPWMSFGKNMVLLFLIIILFLGSKHIKPAFSGMGENSLVGLFTIASIAFSMYCYNYLPVIDFRPYKPGTDIKKSMQGVPDVLKYYYTLKNKKTGATQEFAQFPPNYQDTWDYVSNRTEVIKKGIEPKIKDFTITSPSGNDVTDSVLSNPDYNFLLVSSSLSEANVNAEV